MTVGLFPVVQRIAPTTQIVNQALDSQELCGCARRVGEHSLLRLGNEIQTRQTELNSLLQHSEDLVASSRRWSLLQFGCQLAGIALSVGAGGLRGAAAATLNLGLALAERTGLVDRVASAAADAFPGGGILTRSCVAATGIGAALLSGGLTGELPSYVSGALAGASLVTRVGEGVSSFRASRAQAEVATTEADLIRLRQEEASIRGMLARNARFERSTTDRVLETLQHRHDLGG